MSYSTKLEHAGEFQSQRLNRVSGAALCPGAGHVQTITQAQGVGLSSLGVTTSPGDPDGCTSLGHVCVELGVRSWLSMACLGNVVPG